jgi:hypothetical protein
MKKNRFQKKCAATIIAILVFATSHAQVKNVGALADYPGLICNCMAKKDYGCHTFLCKQKCAIICPHNSNAVSQINVSFILPVKPEILNKVYDLEWASMKPLNTAVSEKFFIGFADNEPGATKLYPVE